MNATLAAEKTEDTIYGLNDAADRGADGLAQRRLELKVERGSKDDRSQMDEQNRESKGRAESGAHSHSFQIEWGTYCIAYTSLQPTSIERKGKDQRLRMSGTTAGFN